MYDFITCLCGCIDSFIIYTGCPKSVIFVCLQVFPDQIKKKLIYRSPFLKYLRKLTFNRF